MKSIKNRSKINTGFRFILIGIIFAISFADPPDWVDNPGAYQFTATIVGGIVLNINGEQMGDNGDMFAAFDDDGNIRGVGLMLFPPFGPYQDTPVFEVQLRSNDASDILHFKYYDASTHIIFDINETYSFVINDILGNIEDPEMYNMEGNGIIEVYYSSDVDIGGFQFDVEGVTVTLASGGAAEAAGFTISSSASTVLGFSLSGSKILAGCGILVTLDIEDAGEPCFKNTVISDNSGNLLDAEVVDCTTINLWSYINGCSKCTVFKENYLTTDNICVPITFSTTNQSTLQAFYFFNLVLINDIEVASNDWVGAFNGDVCVGARQWDTSQCGSGICDLPVLGDDGSDYTNGYMVTGYFPTFKIYDASENLYYTAESSENLGWINNGMPIAELLSAYVSVSGCTNPDYCNYNPLATEDDGSCDPSDESCLGCTDEDACNYSPFATIDNGSCYYEGIYDCAGNCIAGVDCAGVCGGGAIIDECDVCNGDASSCEDCAGTPNGTALNDNCGICIGGSTGQQACIQDCAGIWGGSAEFDACDPPVCSSGTTGLVANTSCSDCGGVPNGDNVEDNCNICDIDASNDCIQDCAGIWGGSAEYDGCNPPVCSGGTIGLVANASCLDCAGSVNGEAFIDGCNDCVGGNTSNEACATDCNEIVDGTAFIDACGACVAASDTSCIQDCAGIWGGSAEYDGCNPSVCSSGTTGLVANASCSDCGGVPNGDNVEDNCNICDTDASNDCIQDCAGIWGGSAVDDACDPPVCSGGTTGLVANASCTDCNDNINGTAYPDPNYGEDSCTTNECIGGNTNFIACAQDCAGVWGGGSADDACGVCGGDGPEEYYDCASSCCTNDPDTGSAMDTSSICSDGEIIVDCSGECGGNDVPTFQCQNTCVVCNPADCINLDFNCNSLDISPYLLPDELGISKIFPNPFNPIAQIQYDISGYALVKVRVFDIQGREVAQLMNEYQSPGQYQISWNADSHASGMYFIEMVIRSGDDSAIFRDIRKILYLK